jgi:hypothetical protein
MAMRAEHQLPSYQFHVLQGAVPVPISPHTCWDHSCDKAVVNCSADQ